MGPFLLNAHSFSEEDDFNIWSTRLQNGETEFAGTVDFTVIFRNNLGEDEETLATVNSTFTVNKGNYPDMNIDVPEDAWETLTTNINKIDNNKENWIDVDDIPDDIEFSRDGVKADGVYYNFAINEEDQDSKEGEKGVLIVNRTQNYSDEESRVEYYQLERLYNTEGTLKARIIKYHKEDNSPKVLSVSSFEQIEGGGDTQVFFDASSYSFSEEQDNPTRKSNGIYTQFDNKDGYLIVYEEDGKQYEYYHRLDGFNKTYYRSLDIDSETGDIVEAVDFIESQIPMDSVNNLIENLNFIRDSIPVLQNRFFTDTDIEFNDETYKEAVPTKPQEDTVDISKEITEDTEENANLVEQFLSTEPMDKDASLPEQDTRVYIKAKKEKTNRDVFLFTEVYNITDSGDETKLATSDTVKLTTSAITHGLGITIPSTTLEEGDRALIKIKAYYEGSGTEDDVVITIQGNTESRFTYNLAVGDISYRAKNASYDNSDSELDATNVQELGDELTEKGLLDHIADKEYSENDVVKDNGKLYRSLKDNNTDSVDNTDSWENIVDIPTMSNNWVDYAEEPSGDGSESDPYIIETEEEAAWISKQALEDSDFITDKYINFESSYYDFSGKEWTPIYIDGSHDISFTKSSVTLRGITMTKDTDVHGSNHIGFFVVTSENYYVSLPDKELTVKDSFVYSEKYGSSDDCFIGTFINSIDASNIGGYVIFDNCTMIVIPQEKTKEDFDFGVGLFSGQGLAPSGLIKENCRIVAFPYGDGENTYIGTMVGMLDNDGLNNVKSYGIIDSFNQGDAIIGGVAGGTDSAFGTFQDVYFYGTINSYNSDNILVIGGIGGMVDHNNQTNLISSCEINIYNCGNFDARIGGIFGDAQIKANNLSNVISNSIINIYDSDSDGYIGGLVGYLGESILSNSINNTTINASDNTSFHIGIFVGETDWDTNELNNNISTGKINCDSDVFVINEEGDDTTIDETYYLENSINGGNDADDTGLDRTIMELKNIVDDNDWDTDDWNTDTNKTGWLLPTPSEINILPKQPEYITTRFIEYILNNTGGFEQDEVITIYDSNKTYKTDDKVYHSGKIWESTTDDNDSEPDLENDWEIVIDPERTSDVDDFDTSTQNTNALRESYRNNQSVMLHADNFTFDSSEVAVSSPKFTGLWDEDTDLGEKNPIYYVDISMTVPSDDTREETVSDSDFYDNFSYSDITGVDYALRKEDDNDNTRAEFPYLTKGGNYITGYIEQDPDSSEVRFAIHSNYSDADEWSAKVRIYYKNTDEVKNEGENI
ncbi:MAG: hypothetical protein ACOCSL_01895 [Thermoplasmatota archaeon]